MSKEDVLFRRFMDSSWHLVEMANSLTERINEALLLGQNDLAAELVVQSEAVQHQMSNLGSMLKDMIAEAEVEDFLQNGPGGIDP